MNSLSNNSSENAMFIMIQEMQEKQAKMDAKLDRILQLLDATPSQRQMNVAFRHMVGYDGMAATQNNSDWRDH